MCGDAEELKYLFLRSFENNHGVIGCCEVEERGKERGMGYLDVGTAPTSMHMRNLLEAGFDNY